MPSFKVLAAAIVMAGIGCGGAAANPALESRFDALINPAEMDGWMKTMAAEPNHVGAPHNKANAELTLAQFREWGWDAKIETFDVLYPTPLEVGLELLGARCDAVLVLLADQPLIGAADLTELIAAFKKRGTGHVLVPVVEGQRGNPIVLDEVARAQIQASGTNLGCRNLIERNPELVCLHQTANTRFVTDLDTPEDVAALAQRTGWRLELPQTELPQAGTVA